MDNGRQRPRDGVGDGTHRPSQLPAYEVEDLHPDPGALTDAWARYMRERFGRREAFYQRLNPAERDLLRKELRRIRWFREHFKDYRIATTDRLSLVALLDDARSKWREIASKRAAEELDALKKETDKNGETLRRSRDRQILLMVQHWLKMEYLTHQQAVLPEEFMGGLEATSDNSSTTEDNPKEHNYGYNGWLILWDQDQGGVSSDHPLIHGKFPHQKISIQQLLYNKENTPLRRTSNKKQLRYFHLPANSMKWVEDAMSRYYGEDGVQFDSKLADHNTKSNAQRLLRNELWRGQQRGGHNLPPHSRQMGARCSVVPSAPWPTRTETRNSSVTGKDFVLFMPFLHWEVEKRLYRMAQFADVAKRRKEVQERLRRANTLRYKARVADIARLQQSKPLRPQTWYDNEDRKSSYWRPRHPLAKYFWHVAKLYQIIDEAADGKLIEDHLFGESHLHMRRTLEQFYYWTAPDTTSRDKEQVVCRGTRAQNEDPDATARLVMVDQLWLWILDENTVISCFPRRWGRNNPDPSAVHRGIRDRFKALDVDEIRSVYDLAGLVVDECSKVFFDRTKPLDQRPDVVDLFSSAISNTAERKTYAYEAFGKDINRISSDTLESAEQLLRKSLNIGVEWNILVEAQNVIEELQVMQEIFTQQINVLKDCHKALKTIHWSTSPHVPYFGKDDPFSRESSGGAGDESPLSTRSIVMSSADAAASLQRSAMERMAALIADMEQRREELASMEKLQNKTRTQLRELLDMKQQQSNIIEAKAAIRRADESVLQGRSIVVFTVVTIFFLPLSFFASVFGMNAPELSEDGVMPLRKQLTLMFGISAAVIFVSLSLAFSTWTRTIITVPLSLLYAQTSDRLGFRNRASAYNSTTLKNMQRERLKQLDTKAMARRLTEISSRARDMSPFHHHHHHHHHHNQQQQQQQHEMNHVGSSGNKAGRSEQEMLQRSPTWTLGRLGSANGVFRSRRLDEDPGSV